LVALITVPFPVVVKAPFIVEPAGAQQVYVTTPGRLVRVYVRPGQFVRRGDVLAELSNPSLFDQYNSSATSYQVQTIELKVQQALADSAEQTVAAGMCRALYEEANDCRERLERLKIKAPCDGFVVATGSEDERRNSNKRVQSLSDGVLEHSRLGAYLPVGMHLLTVAPQQSFQAVLEVDQYSWEDFKPGAPVGLKLAHASHKVLRGVIQSRTSPQDELFRAGDAFAKEKLSVLRQAGSADVRPMSQVVAVFDIADMPVLPGLAGEARLVAYAPSAASWLWRQAQLTFRFD
jgi:multidrug efflux pump subunit AcrA (membrane-fusion protein)